MNGWREKEREREGEEGLKKKVDGRELLES